MAKNIKQATLCFLVQKGRILLGMKKRGFGAGKWNGFGGKVNEDEKIEETAIRELQEECGIKTSSVEKMAELTFLFPYKKEWNQTVHVFLVKEWEGEPLETEEMKPRWFRTDSLPFENMWQDDPHWLPHILKGKKVKARFVFGKDNESIDDMEIHI